MGPVIVVLILEIQKVCNSLANLCATFIIQFPLNWLSSREIDRMSNGVQAAEG